ncbi:MAG: DUF2437 domain-containing protein, partial [Herminiimonas sp.]|nr:DUF2437 domain-containing protein [Herminiimonas sp.]
MTQSWARFQHDGTIRFGLLDGEQIRVYTGDMFADPKATNISMKLADVKLLAPT